MQLHRNAKLGLRGRRELVSAIEQGMSLKAAAAASTCRRRRRIAGGIAGGRTTSGDATFSGLPDLDPGLWRLTATVAGTDELDPATQVAYVSLRAP